MSPGLYIHVPFCRTRCDFCAFYLRVYRAVDGERYLNALRREIDLHAERGTLGGRPVQTVYFGGGTPSILGADALASILTHVANQFGVAPDAEVTIEAHPDDVDAAFARGAAALGCTRLSMGAQALHEAELHAIGRPSSPDRVVTAVEHARRAGIRSINLDLMFGFPGQGAPAWESNVDTALALQPDHLSCYAFTVEDGTKTAQDIARGFMISPSSDVQRMCEDLAAKRLAENGYERYEISNYATPGHRCRHNLLYWTGGDYLGLGPSAQSYVDASRFGVKAHLDRYCGDLQDGVLPVENLERLNDRRRAVEAVIFGLRRLEGVGLADLERACDGEAERPFIVDRLIREGLLERTSERLRLTAEGLRFADSVAEALI